MRKLIAILIVLGASIPVFADNTQRILGDTVLTSTVLAVESKYGVGCDIENLGFRCLNGPQCNYTVIVMCSLPNSSAPRDFQIIFGGFDNGISSDISSIEISKLN